MTEKTEWEVVDGDAPRQDQRQTLQQLMKNWLGPWWRWKVAGLVTIASMALIFLLTVAAVFVLGFMAVAIVSLCILKVRQWMHRRSGTALRERR
jgi:ABC-type phosphate transport system auxiliary subunit